MKRLIEPQSTPDLWRLGGVSALLQIHANQQFDTYNGQYIPASSVEVGLCLEVVCPVVANILEIPEVEIDSTEDSITNPRATYDAIIISRKKRIDFLKNFAVPATLPNLTWPILRLRKAARIPLRVSNTYNSEQIESLNAQALTFLRLASINQVGMAAGTAPAVDPAFPVHVSATDPLWNALLAGEGLITASGKAAMVDGLVHVESEVVEAGSAITCSSMDLGVTGTLRAVNVVAGDGFDIVSNNPGDVGQVAWFLSNS